VEAPDLGLGGRIDLLLISATPTVIDYKTGLVTSDGHPRGHYERQLAIYAALVASARGVSEVEVVLFSLREGLVELSLSLVERDNIVASVIGARDTYNKRSPGPQPANPSDASCEWCPYACQCGAVWDELAAGRMERIGWGEAVEGLVSSSPVGAENGAWAVPLDIRRGTVSGTAMVVDVPRDIGSRLAEGDAFACIGLAARSAEPLVLGWRDGPSRAGFSELDSPYSAPAGVTA